MLFPGIEIEEKKYHPALYLFSLVFGVPIEIYKPVRRFPKGLFLIVLLNFLVFLFLPKGLFKVFGLISSEAFNPLRAYSYITYSFFHVGWLHIILNMYLFWIFGDNLYSLFYEKYSGEKGIKRFVLFSIICTAFSGLTHVILMRSFGDASLLNIPLVGASGLVSAYIAAYYRKFPDAKMYQVVLFYPFKVSVKIYLVFYLGLNLIMAYRYGVYSNISWQCHVGGLVAGYFFVDYFLKDKVEFNS
ncbi:MAG: hypothetical protein C0601_06570 [Candidatus Muiribacterium halophilum]|uniref:Peptidase S54 rhomboid domain-containing protein n=1 Tax=Muiribacterium halophilum TaxID=2053465 RepID=A0A2N5ZGB1_MUIH1|nr:MAG: hypothetical protein C0601_06570 [Candidatus Muirbacterium halophilum]